MQFLKNSSLIFFKARHDRMAQLVETMLDLHKRLQSAALPQEKTQLQRQITAADRQIDQSQREAFGPGVRTLRFDPGGNTDCGGGGEMRIVISKNGVPVRITDERFEHIVKNHPEMTSEENKLQETIENPEQILEGDFGELLAVKFYPKSPVTKNKYLIVAYKEINQVDGFVLTAYFARRLSKRRKTVWKP